MATILKKAGKEAQWLRTLGALLEDSSLGPTLGNSQPPGARAPWDLMLFPGLHGYLHTCAHIAHTDTCRKRERRLPNRVLE